MLKNKLKVLLLLLISVTISVMNFSVAFGESSYSPEDVFTINYAKSENEGAENQVPYIYISPHRGNMGIRDLKSGEMEYWSVSYEVYNLINRSTGESIPAYCTDACTGTVSGHSYTRTNLEDNTYYPEGAAGRIRAICINSFPHIKDIDAIETAANRWLKANKETYTPIIDLTGAEVIAATQYSIWCVANEDDVVNRSPYSSTSSLTEEDLAGEVAIDKDQYVNAYEGKSAHTSNNIKMLHEYFMALDPVHPEETIITDDSIIIKSLEHQQKSDGTFNAVVTFSVNALVDNDDSIIVSARSGNLIISRPLNHSGEQTITLEGLTAHDPVTIALDGGQKANGVFLFTPEGGREASQSMVAYDDSFLPCHGEAVAACNGDEIIIIPDDSSSTGESPNGDSSNGDSSKDDSDTKVIPAVPKTSDGYHLPFFILLLFFSGSLILSIKVKE